MGLEEIVNILTVNVNVVARKVSLREKSMGHAQPSAMSSIQYKWSAPVK